MKEGTIAAENIAQSVYQTLLQNGQYDVNKTYALIGSPSGNPLFYVTPIYDKANVYAKVGGPWWESELSQRTWNGIYKYRLGINLPECLNIEYSSLLQNESVKMMPLYPAEGSIKEINGIIVIKVS